MATIPPHSLLVILSLLISVTFSAESNIVLNSPQKCEANCTVVMNPMPAIVWEKITASQTVTDKVILIYDEEAGTTETIHSTVTVDPSLYRVGLLPTNEAGTVTQSVTMQDSDGGRTTLTLTYPTATTMYASTYHFEGTLPTVSAGASTCLTAPTSSYLDLTYPPEAMAVLTQPPPTIPPGGDKYGIWYTTSMDDAWYPSFWEEMLNRTLHVGAFESCAMVKLSPQTYVQEVLVLTSTSVSTKSKTAASKSQSPTKDSSTTTSKQIEAQPAVTSSDTAPTSTKLQNELQQPETTENDVKSSQTPNSSKSTESQHESYQSNSQLPQSSTAEVTYSSVTPQPADAVTAADAAVSTKDHGTAGTQQSSTAKQRPASPPSFTATTDAPVSAIETRPTTTHDSSLVEALSTSYVAGAVITTVTGRHSTAETPLIAVGTYVVPLYESTVINGFTILATTVSDSGKPQILVAGSTDTLTIAVDTLIASGAVYSGAKTQTTSSEGQSGLGGYIATGLGYSSSSTTSSTAAATFTGAAGRAVPHTVLLAAALGLVLFSTIFV